LDRKARLRLLALGRDGVDLVNEDDGRRVLLGLLKRLAQVGLALACARRARA